jgi:hypothetical protein
MVRAVAVGQTRHLDKERAMPVEDNKQAARRFYQEVINGRNLDAMDERALRRTSPRDSRLAWAMDVLLLRWDTKPMNRIRGMSCCPTRSGTY